VHFRCMPLDGICTRVLTSSIVIVLNRFFYFIYIIYVNFMSIIPNRLRYIAAFYYNFINVNRLRKIAARYCH